MRWFRDLVDALRDKAAGVVEQRLENTELVVSLRMRIAELEEVCRRAGISTFGILSTAGMGGTVQGSDDLIGMASLALSVASKVAGDSLLEIWWATGSKGIVIVSSSAPRADFGPQDDELDEFSQTPMLTADFTVNSRLGVVVVAPEDMDLLRLGEIELPDIFAFGNGDRVHLEKLYPGELGDLGLVDYE